jgi:4-amino-4-deoxy-L-arabinose transferase-like glycosyltransferase
MIRHLPERRLDLVLKLTLAFAGLVILSWVLAFRFQLANLDNDTAQHVSVAQNLLAGKGLSTSLLFYDEHFQQESLPAAQTIWPPGFPLVLAAILAMGFTVTGAVTLVGAASHVLSSVALFALLRRLEIRRVLAFASAAVWLLWTTELGLVNRGYTEPLYILCTLLGTYAFVRAEQADTQSARLKWLVTMGAWLGASFLVRYVGILTIGAGLAAVALTTLKRDRFSRTAIANVVAAGIVPALVVAAVFARNWLITRTMTGWPEIYNEPDPIGALKALLWAIRYQVVGTPGEFDLFWIIGVVLVAGVLAASVWLVRRIAAFRGSSWLERLGPAVVFSVLYSLITVAFLVALAAVRNPLLLQWRYLVPLVPFALLLLAIVAEAVVRTTAGATRQAAWGAMSAWLIALACGQAVAIEVGLTNRWLDLRANTLQAALAAPFGSAGVTVAEQLRRDASEAAPILSNEGQGLGLLLQRPTLSLSPRTFANATWDEAAVHELIVQRNVRWIAFLPRLFDPDDFENSNRPLFISLARGKPPAWLEQVVATDDLYLYRVTH